MTNAISEREAERLLEEAMAILKPEHQTILRLRFFQKLTLREIGERINMNPRAVRRIQHSSISKLRRFQMKKLLDAMEHYND